MRRLDDPLGWRFWIARRQARLSPDPEQWLKEIDQIERSIRDEISPGRSLVDLYLRHIKADSELGTVVSKAIAAQEEPPKRRDLHTEIVRLLQMALVSVGPRVREALLEAYRTTAADSAEHWWILRVLVELADPTLEVFFQELLRDEAERHEAERALSLIRERRATANRQTPGQKPTNVVADYDHFVAGLRDESYFRRWRAAECLGELGDRRAIEPLRAALADPNEYVRRAAEEALIRLEGKN